MQTSSSLSLQRKAACFHHEIAEHFHFVIKQQSLTHIKYMVKVKATKTMPVDLIKELLNSFKDFTYILYNFRL